MYQHKRARSCAGRNAPSSAVRPPALHGATDACRRAGGAVWPPRPAPAGHTGSWHLIEARTTAIAASTLQGARKESPECALTGGSRGGLEVTYHAPPTLPIRRARGASARPGTHAEPAGASGAAGGAPRARRGRRHFSVPPRPKRARGSTPAASGSPRTLSRPWHWMNACPRIAPAVARPPARAAAPRAQRAAAAARAPLGRPCAAASAVWRPVLGAAQGTGSFWRRRGGAHRVAGAAPGRFGRRRAL